MSTTTPQRTHSEFLRDILPHFIRPSLYKYNDYVSRGLVPERSYSYPWKHNPYIPAPHEDKSDPRPRYFQEAFSDDIDWRDEEREVEMDFREVCWDGPRIHGGRSGKGEIKVSAEVRVPSVRRMVEKGGVAKRSRKAGGAKGKSKLGKGGMKRKVSQGSRAWRP